MKRGLIPLLGLLWANMSFGQASDSVFWLKEVLVSEQAEHRTTGYFVKRLSQKDMAANEGLTFTETLSRQIPGGLRTYGISGLSTPNLRGTGSSHTSVLWNGVYLQSPATGQFDLSGVAGGLIHHAAIQYGGSSGAFGSGAVGGTIHLNNQKPDEEGTTLSVVHNAGSFGRLYQRYKAAHRAGKHAFGLSYFKRVAENDFTFSNTSRRDAPTEQWQHAATDRQGMLAEYYWDSERDRIKAMWWWQNNHLDIPTPFTVRDPGEATQQDLFHRALLSWNHREENLSVHVISAVVTNHLVYQNPPVTTESHADFITWQNQANLTRKWQGLTLSGNLSHFFESTFSTGFRGGSTHTRHRSSAQVELSRKLPVVGRLNIGIQQELNGGRLAPFIPFASMVTAIGNDLVIRANASRVYRVPAFNDLYWDAPGGKGDKDLLPEEGWTAELGLDWTPDVFSNESTITFAVFNSLIRNWIAWAPVSASVWSPINLKKVWSRGAQAEAKVRVVQLPRTHLDVWATYQLTVSRNDAVARQANRRERGKQLIYTPIHQGSAGFTFAFADLQTDYIFMYVGRQFTTADNSPAFALGAYGVSNIKLSYHQSFGRLKASLYTDMNNIFNKQYTVRAGYPMPGLNFNLGLNLNFGL